MLASVRWFQNQFFGNALHGKCSALDASQSKRGHQLLMSAISHIQIWNESYAKLARNCFTWVKPPWSTLQFDN